MENLIFEVKTFPKGTTEFIRKGKKILGVIEYQNSKKEDALFYSDNGVKYEELKQIISRMREIQQGWRNIKAKYKVKNER